MDRERPPPDDHPADAKAPNARVAVTNQTFLTLIFLIATSCAEHANDNDRRSAGLIWVNELRWLEGASDKPLIGDLSVFARRLLRQDQ
jgi:hypothetical protein